MGRVLVIGSINVDMVTETDRIPEQGETLIGGRFRTVPGGKGANQAVAAAKAGADVTMIGAVGDDSIGSDMLANLRKAGIDTSCVKIVQEEATGTAVILLTEGDNRIIVSPGANASVTSSFIASVESVIADSDVVLLQLEIPLETVVEAVHLAHKHDVPVVLNPAPAAALPAQVWEKATWITPNEREQQQLFLHGEFREKLITTLGANGVAYWADNEVKQVPGHKVQVTDTTGAGDTFNGVFAALLAEGATCEQAVTMANAAAALSVQTFGAQGGMPDRKTIEAFLAARRPD
ncbi:ribokinase [Alkalicoccus luteus]|uniref:ribokinase n=1 Tax=Alkalicoccus luteus TaxID=1237094 RepID=UPI0040335BC1